MARLYYHFTTNVEKGNDDVLAPYPTKFILQTANGNFLHIMCVGDMDFSLENHEYNGRWKGLSYAVYSPDGRNLVPWSTEDNTNEFRLLVVGAMPVAFAIDSESLNDHGYDSDFIPTCQTITLTIEAYNGWLPHDYEFNVRELMTEAALEAALNPPE